MNHRLSSTANLLAIDVAGWYRDPVVAAALRNRPADGFSDRDAAIVDRLVDELAAADARATFFMEGSTARAMPRLTRGLVRAGHEVAVLGTYGGDDWDDFREELRVSRAAIEDGTGIHVRGFRLPEASPTRLSWRFDVLLEEGFEYDSSGSAGYPESFVCGTGSLTEVPRTASIALRRASYAQLHGVLASRTKAGVPSVASFATWEIDAEQPRVRLPMLTSIRHYSGRRAAAERMRRMIADFRFDAIGHRLSELAQSAPRAFAA